MSFMELSVDGDTFRIELGTLEKVLSFKRGSLEIPLEHIREARTGLPKQAGWDIRAPGAFLPGVVKAGTYYVKRGKEWEREFWYVKRGTRSLTVELVRETYKRIVLGLDDEQNEYWAREINDLVKTTRS